MIFKDLTGLRFERLIALECIKKREGKRLRTYWRCKCDCGNEIVTMAQGLACGGTKSCGCYNRDAHFKHGHTANRQSTLTFNSWGAMLERCYRPKASGFNRYGGRGIIVCDAWKNSFQNFLADMGERPPGKTLDRINSNGNYEPLNCRWATIAEQNSNKSNVVFVTHNGETKTSSEWARVFHVSQSTIIRRFKAEKDISKPQNSRNYYKEKPAPC